MLRRYATNRTRLVEIGVAEGGGAWELRQAMAEDATLFLVDPYHLSRARRLSPARLVARRLVKSVPRGHVRWLELFSHEAAQGWTGSIDFLFIDGDHSLPAVRQDWDDWVPHVTFDGIVALHDAAVSAEWVDPSTGPAVLVREILASTDWKQIDEVDSLIILSRAA